MDVVVLQKRSEILKRGPGGTADWKQAYTPTGYGLACCGSLLNARREKTPWNSDISPVYQ